MFSSTRDGDIHGGEIRLWQEGDWWIAGDVETGVTTQGESREYCRTEVMIFCSPPVGRAKVSIVPSDSKTALENLDDAMARRDGERGRAPTDEELRAAGIDPADNTTGNRNPPDVLY